MAKKRQETFLFAIAIAIAILVTIFYILRYSDRSPVGLDVGLVAVQNLTGPLLPGRWYNIAGSSGSGKTGLVQQVAEFVGRKGFITAVFSADMPADELSSRAMTAESGVASEKIEQALLNLNYNCLCPDTVYDKFT